MISRALQDTTGYLLAQVCKRKRVRAHALLEELRLGRGQPFVLSVLWDKEGISHSELAETLDVQPATVTNMLKRMEKAGFVERRQDAEDQRVSRVYLTDAGRDVRGAVERVWHGLEEQTFAGFTLEERVLFRRLLLQIHQNLNREA